MSRNQKLQFNCIRKKVYLIAKWHIAAFKIAINTIIAIFNSAAKCSIFFFYLLSDIMDLRHQSSAMCIIMLGGEKDSGRFGKNMTADVSAKKNMPKRPRLKTSAETFRMICGAYPVYARSPSPSQRPAPTTITSRSPFPLGLCSCSTSFSKMGT